MKIIQTKVKFHHLKSMMAPVPTMTPIPSARTGKGRHRELGGRRQPEGWTENVPLKNWRQEELKGCRGN